MLEFLGNFRILRGRESCLVVMASAGMFHVSLVARNADANQFEILKTESGTALAPVLNRFPLQTRGHILGSLDARSVSMVQSAISVTRKDAASIITAGEFENIISQGLWKLFNQERLPAAKKMGVADVDVRVADAHIDSIKLDGHSSLNPVGFAAKTIEFSFRQTLVNHKRLQDFFELAGDEQLDGVAEAGAAPAALLARIDPETPFLYITVSETETLLYRHQNRALTYLDSLAWGSRAIEQAVCGVFASPASDAPVLMERYVTGRASGAVLKSIEAALYAELSTLLKAIELYRAQQGKELVYLHSFAQMPKLIFEPRLMKRLHISIPIITVDEAFISQKAGIGLTLSKSDDAGGSRAAFLATLALAYQPSRCPEASRIAKRRAHWLHRA